MLDGSGDVAAVPGEAGTWQRATGPLQFIPSTWERWGSDGDGDGVADPQDIDDAAYAAARYLCASGADLAHGPGLVGGGLLLQPLRRLRPLRLRRRAGLRRPHVGLTVHPTRRLPSDPIVEDTQARRRDARCIG